MSSSWYRAGARAWLPAILLPTVAVLSACAALLAPSDAVIELAASNATIPANVWTSITATVTDATGGQVQDGTRVSFQATMGTVNPPDVRTRGGKATTQFTASDSGTATVVATSGSVTSNPVTITVGPSVTVSLTATPTTTTVNTSVTFTAAVSPSGTAVDHYEWSFGDLATTTTTTNSTQHTYNTTGTMTVTVKAVISGTSGPTAQAQVVVQ